MEGPVASVSQPAIAIWAAPAAFRRFTPFQRRVDALTKTSEAVRIPTGALMQKARPRGCEVRLLDGALGKHAACVLSGTLTPPSCCSFDGTLKWAWFGVAWRGSAWLRFRLAPLCASRRRAKCDRKSKAALFPQCTLVYSTLAEGVHRRQLKGGVRGRAYSTVQPKVVSGCSPHGRRRVSDLRRGSAADASSELPVTPEQVLRTAMQLAEKARPVHKGGERAAKAQGLKDAQENSDFRGTCQRFGVRP